jgi:hypothetical protein
MHTSKVPCERYGDSPINSKKPTHELLASTVVYAISFEAERHGHAMKNVHVYNEGEDRCSHRMATWIAKRWLTIERNYFWIHVVRSRIRKRQLQL